MALGIDCNVCRSLLFLLALGFGAVSGLCAKFGMSVFPPGLSLSLSFLMSVSGSQDLLQVPTPTLCMASVRILAEAASGLCEVHSEDMVSEASGGAWWCEADLRDVVSEASGVAGCGEADSKDSVSETCGGAVTACCSVTHAALRVALLACVLGGSTLFVSSPMVV